ncbi:MAG TPA: methyltransferase domain-containing protein [Acidimicrobiales bacterium]|nr:methyltransferase domain-containing protein [Acidimicrobiales bacterium]
MDRATIDIYDESGALWAKRRTPVRRADALAFARRVIPGTVRIDLGCGAGRYTTELGRPVIGLDASRTMLALCRDGTPAALLVQGDLEALPFRRGCLGGGWANMSYLHVPRPRLPLALADLHRVLAVGAAVDIQVLAGSYEGRALPDDDVGGRFFASWEADQLADILTGAGFDVRRLEVDGEVVRAQAVRARTLADTVGAGLRLLTVGLNPSLYAADAGVGYARPGNRFWPALMAAGIATRDRDPVHALRVHGIGMTDLVKRATVGAKGIDAAEYRSGIARVERLVRWLAPASVCMVGLSGWRAAVDADARPGLQEHLFGGRPLYVMPSTSGANAHAQMPDLVDHLRRAVGAGGDASDGPDESARSPRT